MLSLLGKALLGKAQANLWSLECVKYAVTPNRSTSASLHPLSPAMFALPSLSLLLRHVRKSSNTTGKLIIQLHPIISSAYEGRTLNANLLVRRLIKPTEIPVPNRALEHRGSNNSEHSIVQVQPSDSSRPSTIYLVYCTDPAYPIVYVGMTTEPIQTRLSEHRSKSKKGKTPLYKYMRESGGGTKWEMKILQVLYSPTVSEALDAERRWIDHYDAALSLRKYIFYKLSCGDRSFPITYVGRTTQKITKRMNGHKAESKKGSTRLYEYIRESGGWDKWNYEILEEVVISVNAADERERKWIESTGSGLNTHCPVLAATIAKQNERRAENQDRDTIKYAEKHRQKKLEGLPTAYRLVLVSCVLVGLVVGGLYLCSRILSGIVKYLLST